MSKKDKRRFIRKNPNLPLPELTAKTGFSLEEVQEVLRERNDETKGFAIAGAFPWGLAFLPALAAILVYLPCLGHDFVNWDDRTNIVFNSRLHSLSLDSLGWMLTTFHSKDWMPLTWLSFALNYALGGQNPILYHLTNILLHALNTIMVFKLCWKILEFHKAGTEKGLNENPTISPVPVAFLTALFFALHPLHVESVAWATERKDVLYAFFYLAALLVYLGGARGGNPLGKLSRNLACLGLFILSVMSKSMAVTLPLAFLLLDYWPLRRFRGGNLKPLLEKAPYFLVSLGGGFLALASHHETLAPQNQGLFALFLLNGFRSLVFYLVKMVAPIGLTPIYLFPREVTGPFLVESLLAVLVVAVGGTYCFWRRQKAPYLLVAFGFYLITLSPVLTSFHVGNFAAADRYTYLPSLGIFLPLCGAWVAWLGNRKTALFLTALALFIPLSIATLRQEAVWQNSKTLWERVVQNEGGEDPFALSYLGVEYLQSWRLQEAMDLFQRAQALSPPLAVTHSGIATVLWYQGQVDPAIQEYQKALALDPLDHDALVNLWKIYEQGGRHEEAAAQMKTAIRVDPDAAVYYANLGLSLFFLKQTAEARQALEKAYALDPTDPHTLDNFAVVDQSDNRWDSAVGWCQKGIALYPKEPTFYLRLADLYMDHQMGAQTLETLQTAEGLSMRNPKVLQQLVYEYGRLGRRDLAEACEARAKDLSASDQR